MPSRQPAQASSYSPLFAWVLLAVLTAPAAAARAEPLLAVELESLPVRLKHILENPLIAGSRISALVVDAASGREIFSHRPDSLVNPASVTKIFTTGAALCLLHPDYRFRTVLLTSGKIKDGLLQAPLYLQGFGDPYLVDERLYGLALELYARGLRRFSGPLLVDDSYFDAEHFGPGWEQEEGTDAYLAPVGALSVDFNSVRLVAFPGSRPGLPARVEFLPHSSYLLPDVRVITGRRRSRITVQVVPAGRRDRVRVRGRLHWRSPGWQQRFLITRPARHAGAVLLWALRRAGINTRSRVRPGRVPAGAQVLVETWSPPLSELVRKVNKYSQNFMAETLFKTLGAELLGPPGSWYKGQQVLEAFLDEQLGIAPGSYVLQNGSGLNDVNRVSARQVVTLLRHLWRRFDVRAEFVASLAVAGADGTVDGRFEQPELSRAMRVKTGGLHNVRALAGYSISRSGRVLAFAVIINDFPCRGGQAVRVIDEFASALAQSDADLRVLRTVILERPEATDSTTEPAAPPAVLPCNAALPGP